MQTRTLRLQSLLFSVITLSLLPLVGGGCFGTSGAYMTPQEIDADGTGRFHESPRVVLSATVAALKGEGFDIAVVNPGQGLVKTSLRLIQTDAVGGGGLARAYSYYRQYVVHVTAGLGGTLVRAEPHIFEDETEISDQRIWDINSPHGERVLWQRLFSDIAEAIPGDATQTSAAR
jgi:hypothetical protein